MLDFIELNLSPLGWPHTAASLIAMAAFFPLMESVECEFLRHLGHSVIDHDADGSFSWPRVNVQCEYRSAAQFEDVLTVSLTISRLGTKSVTYRFDIRKVDQQIAEGQMTAVCCRIPDGGGALTSMPIPSDIAAKMRPFLA